MGWTSPRTWVAGETVTAAIMNTHVRDNLKALGDPWTAYTPVWSSSGTQPAVGNGNIAGKWMSVGKLVHFSIILTIGSTSTFGTGSYAFTLPTSSNSGPRWRHNGWIFDTSAPKYYPLHGLVIAGSSALNLTWSDQTAAADDATTNMSGTAPITLATGDEVSINGTYEAA